MVTDIGRNSLDPKEGGPLKHPIMIITNDHDTVGYLADILEREFGFTIITTFLVECIKFFMYRYLSEGKHSFITLNY